MSDLATFLLARIAEDEAEAREWGSPWEENLVQPARVLAECEAKRAIVEQAESAEAAIEGEWNISHGENPGWLILAHLAAVYADHPDYRQEWAL